MSLVDKRVATRYKRLFFISLILLVVALGYLISDHYLSDNTKNISEIKENYKAQVDKNETLLEILKIDGKAFSNQNLKDAIEDYKSLNTENIDKDLKELLDNRIEDLNTQLNNISKNTQSRENLISSLNNKISENKALKEEIKSYDLSADEQLILKNNTIDSLKNALALTQNKLERKENVQVLSFTNQNGNLIRYLGEVKNNKANGGGIGVWDTGSVYTGDWKDNKRHGQGVFEWADGQKYEGNFDNDIRTGYGKYFWPSGEKYVGEFENNRINGEGILYDLDGKIEYEGVWKNGKPKL
jgi:hypothetical protein